MESKIIDGILTVQVNMIQAVALAMMVFYLGHAIRNRLALLQRFSIPAPVVGGLLFALLASILRLTGILALDIDSTLQTTLMLMFFTTIGIGASLVLLRKGGMPLVIFFFLTCVLAVGQNVFGIFLAKLTGIDPLLGIIAGAVTLMGGLGTGGAFGPLFEEWGVTGATTAAIASATFGMVAGNLMGGPFGEWCIKRYKVTTPAQQGVSMKEGEVFYAEEEAAVTGKLLMINLGYIVVAMGFGSILSFYFTKMGITLPAYIGAMLIACIIRNVADFSNSFEIDGKAVDIISDISLSLYITMAINNLKLWELINLAVPLLIILIGQIILMFFFCWLVVFFLMGRDYEATMLSVGMIGFGMGAVPNALVNMQALSQKYGPSPNAFFLVPLVGAFLIDFVNALIITGMASLFR
ncbi:MAG: sodium/glutamate symporter [Anaerosporomusa subterranea]|nr:sodium/glutamate symporter [Anaerosporomusa subterranea]